VDSVLLLLLPLSRLLLLLLLVEPEITLLAAHQQDLLQAVLLFAKEVCLTLGVRWPNTQCVNVSTCIYMRRMTKSRHKLMLTAEKYRMLSGECRQCEQCIAAAGVIVQAVSGRVAMLNGNITYN
jgi:hypothetical protein